MLNFSPHVIAEITVSLMFVAILDVMYVLMNHRYCILQIFTLNLFPSPTKAHPQVDMLKFWLIPHLWACANSEI